MELPDAEVSVLFCDDSEIKDLNHSYRKKNKSTDVLSFPQGNSTLLGDIVISLETSSRQATELGTSHAEEIIRLLIHGLLHLVGYDHEGVSDAEARKMRSLEEELFSQVVIS